MRIISLRFASTLYRYDLENLEEPWHQPRFRSEFMSVISPLDNLLLSLNLWLLSGLDARNFITGETVALDAITDLNIKADYTFYNNLSAFIAVNNILNKDYQRYLYYPRQGINFLIGLTYAF
ncbi:MAG: TonB-dependent receptor [Bacteroidia bacterium]|nr:TonB-dependent receptor [Bacteroidia bacterium]